MRAKRLNPKFHHCALSLIANPLFYINPRRRAHREMSLSLAQTLRVYQPRNGGFIALPFILRFLRLCSSIFASREPSNVGSILSARRRLSEFKERKVSTAMRAEIRRPVDARLTGALSPTVVYCDNGVIK